jgi:hypothetical protein
MGRIVESEVNCSRQLPLMWGGCDHILLPSVLESRVKDNTPLAGLKVCRSGPELGKLASST